MEDFKKELKTNELTLGNINSEITAFNAFTENKEKFEIKMYLNEHNNLIFQCLIKEGITIKKYQKFFHFDDLKHENKLFSICDNINDIKTLIIDYIKNSTTKDESSILAIKKEKKLIIKIPTLINKIKEINIILEEKERNIEDIIDNLEKNINKLILQNENNKKEFETKLMESNNRIQILENKLQKIGSYPDYKKALVITNGFTVKENGYILFKGLQGAEFKKGYINNFQVFYYSHYGGHYDGGNICIYPVSLGDIITFDEPIETFFIPEKK